MYTCKVQSKRTHKTKDEMMTITPIIQRNKKSFWTKFNINLPGSLYMSSVASFIRFTLGWVIRLKPCMITTMINNLTQLTHADCTYTEMNNKQAPSAHTVIALKYNEIYYLLLYPLPRIEYNFHKKFLNFMTKVFFIIILLLFFY